MYADQGMGKFHDAPSAADLTQWSWSEFENL